MKDDKFIKIQKIILYLLIILTFIIINVLFIKQFGGYNNKLIFVNIMLLLIPMYVIFIDYHYFNYENER